MSFFYKHKLFFLYLLFAVCLLPAMIFAYRRPHYNMDMVCYMAVILEMDGHDKGSIHQDVYKAVREQVPSIERGYIINSPGYREKMMNDESYFNGQLPFYRVKPLYSWSSWLLYKAGFSLTKATYLPSIIAFFLCGLLLFYWLSRLYKPLFSFAIALLLMYSGFTISVAQASTPDCLSALFLLLAFYFILKKPSVIAMMLAFVLAIFVRMDNVVTAFLVIAVLSFTRRWQRRISWKMFALACVLMAGAYIFIAAGAANGEWSIWYYPDFMLRFNTAQETRTAFSFSEYFALLYSKAITGVVFSHLSLFLILSVCILYDSIAARKLSEEQFFTIMILLIMFIRFILFPDVSDRFFIAFYFVFVILFIQKFIPMNSKIRLPEKWQS
jgi:hypothetical protein